MPPLLLSRGLVAWGRSFPGFGVCLHDRVCSALPQAGCAPGDGCLPFDDGPRCVPAGSVPIGTACAASSDCVLCRFGEPGCSSPETCTEMPGLALPYGTCVTP